MTALGAVMSDGSVAAPVHEFREMRHVGKRDAAHEGNRVVGGYWMIDSRWQIRSAAIDSAVVFIAQFFSALATEPSTTLGEDFVSKLSDVIHAADERVDLAVYPISGPSRTVVEDLYAIHVRIEDRKIHLTLPDDVNRGVPPPRAVLARLIGSLFLLTRLATRRDARGIEFLFGMGDGPGQASVAFCAADDTLLVPDFEFLVTHGYLAFRGAVDHRWIDWKRRRTMVFWRGSTTGIARRPEDYAGEAWYRVVQRTEVCARLQREAFKESCDVGVSQIVQLSDPTVIDQVKNRLLRGHVDRADQLDHRFMLDIDGNSNAWAGLFQALLMGACVLKVGSEHGYRQWYYDRLIPWRHYIPIAADLSDLEEKVQWALTHEDPCAAIAADSLAFSRGMSADQEIDDACDRIVARFGAARR